jgi:hypothetical protein
MDKLIALQAGGWSEHSTSQQAANQNKIVSMSYGF